jgi:thiol-disulfide isomerase/thioredoxin
MIYPEDLKGVSDTINNGGQVMLFWTADWCPDCVYIKPAMPDLEAEYATWTFVYMDRDKFMDLAIEMGILGIPSFVAFRDGVEVGRFVDKTRKTPDQVAAFIKEVEGK